MLITIFVVLLIAGGSNGIGFPGMEKFDETAMAILSAASEQSIPQKLGAGKSNSLGIDYICARLANMHNNGSGAGATTNEEFLGLKIPLKELGFNIVSQDACERALTQPEMHKYREWVDEYAGYHIGKVYRKGDAEAVDYKAEWYVVGQNGYQLMHQIKGPLSCGADCGCTDRGVCSWSWQYVDGTDSPYVQRWNPRSKSVEEAVSLGFPLTFKYLGRKNAECIVWLSLETSCLQCFNRYTTPTRTTIACYDWVGQFQVVDE